MEFLDDPHSPAEAGFAHGIDDCSRDTGSMNAPEVDASVLAPQLYPLPEGLQVW